MKHSLFVGFVLFACAGMSGDCDGDMGMPVVVCNTTYFNEEWQAGFTPPAGLVGPVERCPGCVLDWRLPGEDFLYVFSLGYGQFDGTLQEAAARVREVYFPPGIDSIVQDGPVVLNNGQAGWQIVSKAVLFPEDITKVVVLGLSGGRAATIEALGTTLDGTNDLEFLLGVCRTLCIGTRGPATQEPLQLPPPSLDGEWFMVVEGVAGGDCLTITDGRLTSLLAKCTDPTLILYAPVGTVDVDGNVFFAYSQRSVSGGRLDVLLEGVFQDDGSISGEATVVLSEPPSTAVLAFLMTRL